MSTFLVGSDIKKQLLINIHKANTNIFIASAFVKAAAFEELCKTMTTKFNQTPVLIVRWDLNDLLLGASDLEIYNIAKQYGWKIYINFKLHAKVYIVDNLCMVGSSNLTNRGLMGGDKIRNIESVLQVENQKNINEWFISLINKSHLLNDDLYKKNFLEVNSKKKKKIKEERETYSKDFLLSLELKIKLYTKDLFWSEKPSFDITNTDFIHDVELLGININDLLSSEVIKKEFLESYAWLWLQRNIQEEKYFGELSQLLHNSLLDDPVPYRKTVKILLRNLLTWANILLPEVIIVDRPNHSQRIRLL